MKQQKIEFIEISKRFKNLINCIFIVSENVERISSCLGTEEKKEIAWVIQFTKL